MDKGFNNVVPMSIFPQVEEKRENPREGIKNKDKRDREWLEDAEVQTLLTAAKANRHGHRDYTLLLIMYRHGLRCHEAVNLRWEQVDFKAGTLSVKRCKGGKDTIQDLDGDEIRALRRLQRENVDDGGYVFVTERKGPMSEKSIASMVLNLGRKAGFQFDLHPHMLRHSCGRFLALEANYTDKQIQAHLGHSVARHTQRYTDMRDARLPSPWRK